MRHLANLIGELGGETWTTASAATVSAGILALLAAVITARVLTKQGDANRLAAAQQAADVIKKDRELASSSAEMDRELAEKTAEKDRKLAAEASRQELDLKAREYWWERFTWACREFTADDRDRLFIGFAALEDLQKSAWAHASDRLLVASVLRRLVYSADEEGAPYDAAP